MNDSVPTLQVECYVSSTQPGRYSVEISGYVDGEFQTIANRLDESGYTVLDADQWGQSYRHGQRQNCLAELEESDEPFAGLRLCLSTEDLPGSQAYNAIGALYALYLTLTEDCIHRYGYGASPFSQEPDTRYGRPEDDFVNDGAEWFDLDSINRGP